MSPLRPTIESRGLKMSLSKLVGPNVFDPCRQNVCEAFLGWVRSDREPRYVARPFAAPPRVYFYRQISYNSVGDESMNVSAAGSPFTVRDKREHQEVIWCPRPFLAWRGGIQAARLDRVDYAPADVCGSCPSAKLQRGGSCGSRRIPSSSPRVRLCSRSISSSHTLSLRGCLFQQTTSKRGANMLGATALVSENSSLLHQI